MSSELSCSISDDKDCAENCVENFYKTDCSGGCDPVIFKESLYCPKDKSCSINLGKSWKLIKMRDICNGIQATGSAISLECGILTDWFKMKIWIDNDFTCDSMLSNDIPCICKECYYDVILGCIVKSVYCSCKAVNHLENSTSQSPMTTSQLMTTEQLMTSPDVTSTEITSSGVTPTVTDTTSALPPSPMIAAESSNSSAVTGAAVGGFVGLLLLILMILFAIGYRKKRLKNSKDRDINTQPSISNRRNDFHNGSFVSPMEETDTSARDYDYANHEATQTAFYEAIVGDSKSHDYDLPKPKHEEKYLTLYPDGDTRNKKTDVKDSSDYVYENDTHLPRQQGDDTDYRPEANHVHTSSLEQPISDSVYENSLRHPQLQSEQNDRSDAMCEDADYNMLNQDRSDKILDPEDDQYQHVKNVQNSKGQDDYDELAKPFKKENINQIEDDYDHCKVPSRQHGDNIGDDYDHLN